VVSATAAVSALSVKRREFELCMRDLPELKNHFALPGLLLRCRPGFSMGQL
jgi:hypothetical protein